MHTYNHIPGVQVKALFRTERQILYRYSLEVTKTGASELPRTACVIMQNPSYANEKIADKSVQLMEKIVFELGLPGFRNVEKLTVVNLFGRVQTRNFKGLDSDIGSGNDEAIQKAFEESKIIIIAWGLSNRFKERKKVVLEILRKIKGKKIFKTESHPSRGKFVPDFIKQL